MNSEKTKAFIELVKNNPDLPVVPFVRSEVVGDDEEYSALPDDIINQIAHNKAQSSWASEIEKFKNGGLPQHQPVVDNERSRLIGLRRR